MKLTKNVLPMLYMSGIVAGATTIIALSDVPKPICSVERDDLGNPINVIGKVSLNKTARMTALLSALAMIGGFGTLAVKSLKGEDLELDESVKSLSSSKQSIMDLGNTPQSEMEYVPAGIATQHQQPLNINLNKSTTAPKQTRDIVNELASSHQSTVIVAEPGCGKSTLEKAVLSRLIQTYSQWDVYIIGMKNDSWMGLSQDKEKFCFYQDDPKELMEIMESVHDELLRRLGTPEGERDFNNQPLVLLLDDFPAICSSLKGNPCLDRLKRILAKILTTGREVFVVAHVITQSFNVTALGLDDANIRGSMNLIALIKSNKDDSGRNDGGVGTATRMICNQSIIGDNNQRQDLLNRLPKLVKETEATGLPAMVVIAGTTPYMGMLPNLKGTEVKVNVIKQAEPTPEPIPDTDTANFNIASVVETLNKTLSLDVDTQDTTLEKLSDKELHIKCQRYASQGYSLYAIITRVFLKPNKGRAFTDAQKRIQNAESQFGKIDFPNKNNNN